MMAKKGNRQSVESDVSNPEQALAQVGQVSPIKPAVVSKLAAKDPQTPKGYERLGAGGPAHTGKPTATDNRGEGQG